MANTLNADSAGQRVTKALQPVVDYRVSGTKDPAQNPPTPTPMPAPLRKACGIGQS
ncbi:hypothetical protein JQ615_11975 [Bradyrhizobium jicamae]|uniref:Uncharacterized protein n=1 Tax=Bradyrhizobium jicamae TaxID=280332 RepID=A0ABS5FH85_9BRAD|nr:hypothetical protein [Bradyrhizobium jicamae]MBR0796107.1 hypothetical protein [Bradyrhizobium jicamae]